MKVTVLGQWAPYPRAGGACNGFLIEHNDSKLLLECGNGVFSKLQQYSSFWQLNAIICSHLHIDHCGDLPLAGYAVKAGMLYDKIKQKMPVYLPKNPELNFSIINWYKDYLKLIDIGDLPCKESILIGNDFYVSFFPVQHPIKTFGVIIVAGGKRIVYFGDTEYFPELIEYAHGADLLISEAAVLEENKEYAATRHLTTSQAGEIARGAKVKNFLPTHFFPEHDLKHIKTQIEKAYGKNVDLAFEGKVIEV